VAHTLSVAESVWAVPYRSVACFLSTIAEFLEESGGEFACWSQDAAVKRSFKIELFFFT
jgi:hypothetical protein